MTTSEKEMLSSKRVLIVDSYLGFVQAVTRILQNIDYNVLFAENMAKFLEKITEPKPNLVILDIETDAGKEVLKLFLPEGGCFEIPLITVSNSEIDFGVLGCESLINHVHFVKPVDRDALRQAVHRLS